MQLLLLISSDACDGLGKVDVDPHHGIADDLCYRAFHASYDEFVTYTQFSSERSAGSCDDAAIRPKRHARDTKGQLAVGSSAAVCDGEAGVRIVVVCR